MINIEIKDLNIHIDNIFDMRFIATIKDIKSCRYLADVDKWEAPIHCLDKLEQKFKNLNLEYQITGDVLEYIIDGINTPFFTHQKQFLKWAEDKTLMLLGDEQGCGKTLQSIALAIHRKNLYNYTHCLIVTGVNDLKHNWKAEISKHCNESSIVLGERLITKGLNKGKIREGGIKERYDDLACIPDEFFWITNIETMRDKEISNLIRDYCRKDIIQLCIADEIHKMKNPVSKQGDGFRKKILCTDRLALTGTPLLNSPLDLYTILNWLGQEPRCWTQFKAYYCIMDKFNLKPIGFRNLFEIKQKLDHIMLRRLKSEVLDLPEKIESIDYITMGAAQQEIYNEVLTKLRKDVDKIILNPNPLASLIRLRQATGYTGILSSTINESCKFIRALELISDNDNNGGKTLIFSESKEIIKAFIPHLTKFNPAVIHGDIDSSERKREIDRFQNDDECRVILGTTKPLGTGWTLTKANLVIFLDSPWTPGAKNQAMDRAHRIGTQGTVNVITLVCKDTVDEKIEQLLNTKSKMANLILGEGESIDNPQELIRWLLD